MHERLDEYNILKSETVVEFKNKYNLLLTDIENYKFRENSSKGFAVKQNRNSQMILSDMQMLNAILDETLQRIDNFFVESNQNEYTKLKDIIDIIVKRYINEINNSREMLQEAMYEYYDYRNNPNRFENNPNKKNSAVRARIWKKERNNALSNILRWSINLISLRDMVEKTYFKNFDSKYIEKYQEFIDYLSSRSNYYSYFNTEEQIDETKKNKDKKRKLKVNDRLKSKHSN